jgi:hypothetical protein
MEHREIGFLPPTPTPSHRKSHASSRWTFLKIQTSSLWQLPFSGTSLHAHNVGRTATVYEKERCGRLPRGAFWPKVATPWKENEGKKKTVSVPGSPTGTLALQLRPSGSSFTDRGNRVQGNASLTPEKFQQIHRFPGPGYCVDGVGRSTRRRGGIPVLGSGPGPGRARMADMGQGTGAFGRFHFRGWLPAHSFELLGQNRE